MKIIQFCYRITNTSILIKWFHQIYKRHYRKTCIHLTKLNINRRNNKVFSLIIGYSLIAISFNSQYKWSCSNSKPSECSRTSFEYLFLLCHKSTKCVVPSIFNELWTWIMGFCVSWIGKNRAYFLRTRKCSLESFHVNKYYI